MHIRMLKSFTYPYAEGGVTRTLPEGQTFNEPAEIAEYAIEHGFAEPMEQIRRREPVLISEEIDEDLDVGGGGGAGADGETDPALTPEPEPEPVPESGRRGRKSAGEVAPADPVEPA